MKTKREYIHTLRKRYKITKTKNEKTLIINEAQANLGKDRKYITKVLNGKYYNKYKKRKKRKETYPYKLKVPLKLIWETLNYPCSKNLKPQIPEIIKKLKQFNEINLSQEDEYLLCKMGTSTIDRFLNYIKYNHKARGLSGTKKSPLLKTLIPIRTNFDEVDEPGHVEQDCVLHCGDTVSGKYAETLNTLDIETHWNEQTAILNKTMRKIVSAFHEQRHRFPFAIKSTDFDNGFEFVNKIMYQYCKTNNISFTRSRPYKKNDQAHIEGKNYQSVRKMMGYERIESLDIVDLMNDIYKNEYRLLNNFFFATRKLESKVREGGKLIKKYGKAKTPYQRILESKKISITIKSKLMLEYKTLNPAELKRNLNIKLEKLNKMISVSKINQATTTTT